MISENNSNVLVRVEATDARGREIGGGFDPVDSLGSRAKDIERGIAFGSSVIGDSITKVTSPRGWSVDSVEVKFGITLGAEGSVIVSKASFEASFEVTVRYGRQADHLAASKDT
jgi:hypothetical protein